MAFYQKGWTFREAPAEYDPQAKAADKLILDHMRANYTIVEPSNTPGGCTVAPLPYPDFPDDGSPPTMVLPDRMSTAPDDYSPWLLKVRGVRMANLGGTKVTMIFDEPSPADNPRYNSNNDHPYDLVIRACMQATKGVITTPFGDSQQEGWAVLVKKDDAQQGQGQGQQPPYGGAQSAQFAQAYGQQPAYGFQGAQQAAGGRKIKELPFSSVLYFMNCLLYAHGDQVYSGAGNPNPPRGVADAEPLPILLLTQQGGGDLVRQLGRLAEVNQAMRGDDVNCYMYPQVTGHKFLNVYAINFGSKHDFNLENAKYIRQVAQLGPGARLAPPQQKPTQVGFGYGVRISDTSDGTPTFAEGGTGATIDPNAAAQIALKKVRPWDKVLKGSTNADVAYAMAALPPGLLWYAWRQHQEYLPQYIKDGPPPVRVQAPAPQPPAQPQGWGQPAQPVQTASTPGYPPQQPGAWGQPTHPAPQVGHWAQAQPQANPTYGAPAQQAWNPAPTQGYPQEQPAVTSAWGQPPAQHQPPAQPAAAWGQPTQPAPQPTQPAYQPPQPQPQTGAPPQGAGWYGSAPAGGPPQGVGPGYGAPPQAAPSPAPGFGPPSPQDAARIGGDPNTGIDPRAYEQANQQLRAAMAANGKSLPATYPPNGYVDPAVVRSQAQAAGQAGAPPMKAPWE